MRLSAQRALVGQVTPKLFGACVDLRGKEIVLTFYVAPDLTDDERDDLTTAGAMVIADYTDDHCIREDLKTVESDWEPLKTEGTWVLSKPIPDGASVEQRGSPFACERAAARAAQLGLRIARKQQGASAV